MTTTSYNIYQQITSVRLATTANLTANYFNGSLNNGIGATLTSLSVGSLSIDGVLVEVGDRLLIKDQTSSNQNGLYVVQSAGSFAGLWMIERAPDFQSVEQLKVGQYFSVGAGNTLAGSIYVLVEPLPSTIGMGTFEFVNVADSVVPSGPYLLKANNLTDVSNPELAFQNLGTGTGLSITITDGDFSGGVYQIPVPFPVQLVCNNLSVGSQQIRLPVADTPFDSPALGQGPIIKMIDCVATDIALSDGTVIDNLEGFDQSRYICSSKSTSAGSYTILPELYLLNSLSGRVDLTSNDSSITITPNVVDNTVDLSVSGAPGSSPPQLLYVDALNGSDLNDGSIGKPFATYEAARLYAVAQGASIAIPFLTYMIGAFSITGNMTITPFVSVQGTNDYSSRISLTGNIVLDNAWNTTSNPFCLIGDINFVGSGGINLTYTTFQSGSFLRFQNLSMQLSSIVISGAGTNTSCERIVFNNCNTDGLTEPSITSDNVNLYLFNTNPSSDMDISVTSATSLANFILTGTQTVTGNVTLNALAAGTLTTAINSSNTSGKTLTINGTSNTVSIDATSYNFSNYVFSGGASYSNINGGIPLIIYIDQLNGNDNNSGTINYPMKNYNSARLAAIARLGANLYLLGCTIEVIGNQNITGNMILTPGISIDSANPYLQGFEVSGDVVLDPSWGTNYSYVQVRNVYIFLSGGSYSFIFPAIDPSGSSFLKFVDCQLNDMTTMTITGFGSNHGIENVVFENCTSDTPPYSPSFSATNVNLHLINTDLSDSNISMTVSTALGFNYVLAINDARFYTGNITVITNNTSTLTTYINACNTMSKTLTINGANNTVYVDSTSYMFTLVLAGGATLANLNLPTKTDGMTNSSYSPSSYTPAGDTLYAANTLTGNLKGIDNALTKTTLNGMTVSSSINTSAVSILRSHEIKLGNMVVGSIAFTFTSTASPVVINFTKSYGSGFSTNINQAIGSGISSTTSLPAIGDASVESVIADFPNPLIKLTVDVSSSADYEGEINFTYEVT